MRSYAIVFLILVVAGVPASAVASAQTSASFLVAGFSFERAFAESNPGKVALAKLNAVRDQKRREIDQKNQELSSQVEAFQRSLGTLSSARRTEQTQALDRFRINTERFIQDAQAEFMGAQKATETAFLATLQPILEALVKQRGIHILLNIDEKERVLWSSPEIDITNEVILALNRPQ